MQEFLAILQEFLQDCVRYVQVMLARLVQETCTFLARLARLFDLGGFLLHLLQFILVIGTDDRAIIKLYSGTLLQLFHVTWHIIIGQKGGVCTTYAMNPRNLKQ